MDTAHRPDERPGTARSALATLAALVGTLVWTHALAGLLRAAADLPVATFAPASTGLSLAAVAVALAGCTALRSPRVAATRAALMALVAWGVLVAVFPATLVAGLALPAVGAAFSAAASWLARRLPASFDELPRRHPKASLAWLAIALLAVVQVGRLSTYMTDSETDWFLSTRHPFYAKHECMNAYVFGAELDRRGEPNVYHPEHYPGLNPEAAPVTEMTGMAPEDPFQYPPQFLLLPRLAIEATSDYGAVRLVWFGLNVTLCLAAVLALAVWVGGAVGRAAGLLSPAVLASFPVLHDFQYGQFHFAAIALAVLGSLAFQRKRPALGGWLLAGAILAKLFPAVLLIPLAVQRRWRELAWTAGAGIAITAVALLVLGTAPFEAFGGYHLPRLADGSAFAFGEAWPEVATLVTAGNQGASGIVHKLAAMGVPWVDASVASIVGKVFGLGLLALALLTGLRAAKASRAEHAIGWLGLLGLGSLASTGAWADYVPLTCVWLLAYLAPLARGRSVVATVLALCALMQMTLLGTMPLGSASDAAWMMPLSLLGAVLMLGTFVGAVLVRPSPRPAIVTSGDPRGRASIVAGT